MSDLILHHYAASPYGEKIRALLGYKRLAWTSVEISPVMPRPRLMPLTGGYRRSPILQVGADVYCDTRCIALFLERHAPDPTLFPPGSRGLSELLTNWVEPRVFLSAGPVRLGRAEDIEQQFQGGVTADRFVADRVPFMLPALDVLRVPANLPAAQDQLRSFLATISSLLEQGRAFLVGERPSLADFSAFHTVWWLRRSSRVAALDEFPLLDPWADRIAAFGHGYPTPASDAEALAMARHAEPVVEERSDPLDPHGRQLGDEVTISADDYGQDRVAGRLVGLSRETVSIVREDPLMGRIVSHFPRVGFRVLAAEAQRQGSGAGADR